MSESLPGCEFVIPNKERYDKDPGLPGLIMIKQLVFQGILQMQHVAKRSHKGCACVRDVKVKVS